MQGPLIDFDAALERLGGDREFLIELLDELVIQIDEDIKTLANSIEKKDFVALRSTAHGLKGASANLNVEGMAELFKDLEDMGAGENMDGADSILEDVRNAQEKLKEYLKNI